MRGAGPRVGTLSGAGRAPAPKGYPQRPPVPPGCTSQALGRAGTVPRRGGGPCRCAGGAPVVLGVLTSAGCAAVTESAVRWFTPWFRYGVNHRLSMPGRVGTGRTQPSAPRWKEWSRAPAPGGTGTGARLWESPGAGGMVRRDVACRQGGGVVEGRRVVAGPGRVAFGGRRLRRSGRGGRPVPESWPGLDLPALGRLFPPWLGCSLHANLEAAVPRHVCAVFRHPARARREWTPSGASRAPGTRNPSRANPCLRNPLTRPARTRWSGPASSAPAVRASRSGGCAHGSGRAPCRPRSACARGRPRCRTSS